MPYTNPNLMLQGPDEGSLLDPSLSEEEVQKLLGTLVPKNPQAVPAPKPSTPSMGDLLTMVSPPVQDPKDIAQPQPTKATAPPTGGLAPEQETQVHPTTGEVVPPETEEAETERRFKLLEKLRPQQDYFKQAEELYGPAPAPPKPIDQGSAILASLGPAIAGLVSGGGTRGFRGSAAMLSGLMAGQTQAQRQYAADTMARRHAIAQTGAQLGTAGEARFRDLMTAVHQERTDRANALWRKLQGQRYQDQTRISEERLAFDKLKELDLQGYRTQEVRLGDLRARNLQLHMQADEALAANRLDVYQSIQTQMLGIRREELGVHREMVGIARQRVMTGGGDPLKAIEGVQRMIDSITTELGTVGLDATTQGMLRDQLGYYNSVLGELQQKAVTRGTTTVQPVGPRKRVRDIKSFVDRWRQTKVPVDRATWNSIDPVDQAELKKQGVTFEP